MPRNVDFSGPYLKTERAKHHIDELKRIFKVYVSHNKHAVAPKYNRKPRTIPLGTRFPKHTPTILGDALHNLRAALDHAYCELVKANGHTISERSFFPIVNPNGKDTWQSRKAMMEGHEKYGNGPGIHIIKLLSDHIQPWVGGKGEDLAHLHELDISDKHMILLPTQQQTRVHEIRSTGGGRIAGITFVTDGTPILTLGPEFSPDPKHNNQVGFEICFGEAQPFEGQPILPVLERLFGHVGTTLKNIELSSSLHTK